MRTTRAIFIICALVAAGCQPPPEPEGFAVEPGLHLSDGSPDELWRTDLLPRLRPSGVRTRMFSSYDRTGGNDDGFSGAHSRLRVEGGRSVLAEMKGPGIVRRIYFAESAETVRGLLGRRGEHLRVHLDGASEPALDVPVEDLFAGRHPAFPAPLATSHNGGFVSYVPLPYRTACKVTVDGTDVHFYQINYTELPAGSLPRSFSATPDAETRDALERAARALATPGEPASAGIPPLRSVSHELRLERGEVASLRLPGGPAVVRALFVEAPAAELTRAAAAHLQIAFDGAAPPAVNVPLGHLFAQSDALPFRSLLTGTTSRGWYSYFPMPYARSATVTIRAAAAVAVTLRFLLEPLAGWSTALGYLHAAYNAERPTRLGAPFPMALRLGRGHLVGTYVVTRGFPWFPYWLEGDERYYVDFELVSHGTGHEEYWNAAWYGSPGRLDRPFAAALSGVPVYGLTATDMRVSGYRWHVPDALPYEVGVLAEIEHGPQNIFTVDYESVTFFYDQSPAGVYGPEP